MELRSEPLRKPLYLTDKWPVASMEVHSYPVECIESASKQLVEAFFPKDS